MTSEGEGQAARAKTEADKAAASAALAGDIVAASALPLPDVWAPLSDSLRMITGYGREVKVGDDVVARMVNFSRNSTATYIGKDGQLKTAAANEPRFEKEGLLLEGQSTNLIARSEGISMSNPGGSSTVVQNNIADFLPGFLCVRVTFNNPTASNGDHIRVNPSVQAGKTYTWSIVTDSPDRRVFVYTPGPGVIQNSVFSVTKISERLWRQANTFTLSSAFVPGTDYFDVRITAGSTVAGTVVNAGAIQLEELPFASSYIPTNGAAVTRAADQAWLPTAGNRFIGGLYAAAFEFDLLGRIAGASFSRLVDFDNSGGSDRQHISIAENGQLQCVMGPSQTAASVTGKLAGRAAMRMSNFALNVMMDGVAGSSVTASGGGASANNRIVLMNSNMFNLPSYGHIRNMRVWSKHPISNDQLRTAV
ncbi:phage head spike fiber domain-containing protein [Aeromonas caviae]